MKDIKEILKEREKSYGDFHNVSWLTQDIMSKIMQMDRIASTGDDHGLSHVHLEAIHMIVHKISRLVCGNRNHVDSVQDIVGYAELLLDYVSKQEP